MSRNGPRNGPEAFWFFMGIAAVLAIVTTYWYVLIGIAVVAVIAVAWFAARSKPYDVNSPEAKARRIRTFKARDSLRARHGFAYVADLATACDVIADRGTATEQLLQQRLSISHESAAILLGELEQLQVLAPQTNGSRRKALVSKAELRETAALLRSTP